MSNLMFVPVSKTVKAKRGWLIVETKANRELLQHLAMAD